jgi:hypothetical protein
MSSFVTLGAQLKGRSSGQPAEVQKDGPLSASWWFKPVVGDT